MFCGNCGKEIPENAAFCPECGAKNEAVQQVEAVQQAVVEQPVGEAGGIKKALNLKKIIIAAVVVVVAVVGIGFVAGGRSSDKVVDEYFASSIEGVNVKAIWNIIPEELREEMVTELEEEENLYGEDEVLNYLQEQLEEQYDDLYDYINDQLGEDWKITYEITDEDVKDKSELRDINKSYRENGVEGFTADAAKSVRIETTITPKDGEEISNHFDIDLIKVGRKWYLDPSSIM